MLSKSCLLMNNNSMKVYKIPVKELNNLLCCPLCEGYYRDAHTLPECMHTFCKSCIVKHFHENNNRSSISCPECNTSLGLLKHLSSKMIYDRDLQSFVDKLFPHYQANEKQEEIKFYQDLGMVEKRTLSNNKDELNNSEVTVKRSKLDNTTNLIMNESDNIVISTDKVINNANDDEIIIKEDEYTFKLDACRLCDTKLQLPSTSKKFIAGLTTKLSRVQKFIYKRISDSPDFNKQLKVKDIEILLQNKGLEGDSFNSFNKEIKKYLKDTTQNNSTTPILELTYRSKVYI